MLLSNTRVTAVDSYHYLSVSKFFKLAWNCLIFNISQKNSLGSTKAMCHLLNKILRKYWMSSGILQVMVDIALLQCKFIPLWSRIEVSPLTVDCYFINTSKMKHTLTWWGGFIKKKFRPVNHGEELLEATLLRSSKSNVSSVCQCQGRI